VTPYAGAPAYKTAGHYTGWAADVDARLAEHASGQGARLTQVQLERGGTWRLADVQPGGRTDERRLKQHGAARRCPICRTEAEAELAHEHGWESAAAEGLAANAKAQAQPDAATWEPEAEAG
jgi:predicted GIY-YIG superfamily endonuclease